jgi:alpha-tubulin suppressor-like RCC1 family protein
MSFEARAVSWSLAGRVILGTLVTGVSLSCDHPNEGIWPPTPPDTVARLIVVPRSATVVRGATLQLTAYPYDAAGRYLFATTRWTSSNPNLVAVSDSGLVGAKDSGTATIIGRNGHRADSAVVHVVVVSFTSILPAQDHACGVTTAAATFCWGLNSRGELAVENPGLAHSTPGLVRGGLRFTTVAPGARATCGLVPGGAAYCWGDNYGPGVLGSAAQSPDTLPTPVSGGMSFTTLQVGGTFACGLVAGGAAYCWGAGPNELGTNVLANGHDTFTPVPVLGSLSFTLLRSGNGTTCGLVQGGAAYCWGGNGYGQLGNDTISTDPPFPIGPVPVTGGLYFSDISTSGTHACAIALSRLAYCWGQNTTGELGTGDTVEARGPVPVTGGLAFQMISAGNGNTCGITTEGLAACWGSNNFGQLGTGTIDYVPHPTPALVIGGMHFRALTTRNATTCGLTADWVAYCWGYNRFGQLGNAAYDSTGVPVRVVGQQ